jgi:hypothetical protein
LARLRDEFTLSKARRPVIGIVADPGLGKTRLVFEFLQRVKKDEALVLPATAQPTVSRNLLQAIIDQDQKLAALSDHLPRCLDSVHHIEQLIEQAARFGLCCLDENDRPCECGVRIHSAAPAILSSGG